MVVRPFDFQTCVVRPAFAFCFGDAGQEVVPDLLEAVALGGVDSQERASDAGFSELTV